MDDDVTLPGQIGPHPPVAPPSPPPPAVTTVPPSLQAAPLTPALRPARMSAVVTYGGQDWPVYLEGSGGFSGSSLFAEIETARVGAMTVPGALRSPGSDALEAIVNDRLGRIPGLQVDTLSVTPEGVHVIGTIWETAEYVPVG